MLTKYKLSAGLFNASLNVYRMIIKSKSGGTLLQKDFIGGHNMYSFRNRFYCYLILIFCLIITTGITEASDYRLGVGDLIRVSVWGHADLSIESQVRPDGFITVPLAGDIYVVGNNVSEVARKVESELANYIVDPQVTVMVVQFRKIKVQVLGEVRSPGIYAVETNFRVMDALGLAGGPTALADLTNVTLTRRGVSQEQADLIQLNLNEYIQSGVLQQNPVLEDGDVIHLSAAGKALVLGEVKIPGGYIVTPAMDILDLLALAGGPVDRADLQNATLTRKNNLGTETEKIINLEEIMKQGKGVWLVQPDDVLYIPAKQQVVLFGEVKAPGTYYLPAGASLLDILGLAGGLTPKANSSQIRIVRESNGEQEVLTVDASQATKGQIGGDNPRLLGGDVIYVPEGQSQVLVLGEVRSPGYYYIDHGNKVLDAIAKAGGTTDSADTVINLNRKVGSETQVIAIDLNRVLAGEEQNNYQLIGGDVIVVPETNRRVLVLGQVARPGAYNIDQFTRLLDIIALAGGTTARALTDQIAITSSTNQEEVDYINLNTAVMDNSQNRILRGGEIVFIPEAKEVLVMGEVVRPGAFIAPQGARILDLLALAGGTKSNSGAQNIVLTRQGNSSEQVWVTDYHTLVNAQQDANLLVQGGDVIFVPEAKNQVLVLGEVTRPGVYSISDGAKVLDAIALAGGPKERAALESIGIYRDGNLDESSTLAVGKDKLLFQGNANENPPIMGGDIIYVPETNKPNWTEIFGFMGGIRTFQQIIDWFYNFFDN